MKRITDTLTWRSGWKRVTAAEIGGERGEEGALVLMRGDDGGRLTY
jgi:hypothetical protein